MLLVAVSIAIAVVQHYLRAHMDIIFLADIGILALAYVFWLQVLSRKL
jgi:hypothetical protein